MCERLLARNQQKDRCSFCCSRIPQYETGARVFAATLPWSRGAQDSAALQPDIALERVVGRIRASIGVDEGLVGLSYGAEPIRGGAGPARMIFPC